MVTTERGTTVSFYTSPFFSFKGFSCIAEAVDPSDIGEDLFPVAELNSRVCEDIEKPKGGLYSRGKKV